MIIDNRYYRIKSIFGYRLRALVYTTEYTMVSKITYMTLETGSRGILKRKYNIAIKKYIFVDPNIFRKLLARQTIYRVSKYD